MAPTITPELRVRLEGRVELLEESLALGHSILELTEDDWCWQLPARAALLSRYLSVREALALESKLEVLATLRQEADLLEARVEAWARARWDELPPGAGPAPAGLRAALEGLAAKAPLERGRTLRGSDGPGALLLLALAVLLIAGLTSQSIAGAVVLGVLAVASFFLPRPAERWWLLEDALVLDGAGGPRRIALSRVTRAELDGGQVAFWGDDPRAPLARVRSPRWRGVLGLMSVLRCPLRTSPRTALARLSLAAPGVRPDPAGGPPEVGCFIADEDRAVWVPDGVATAHALQLLELESPLPRLHDAARELLLRDAATRQALLRRLDGMSEVSRLRLGHARVRQEKGASVLECRELKLELELDPAQFRLLEQACAG